jgi:hypothetical protein
MTRTTTASALHSASRGIKNRPHSSRSEPSRGHREAIARAIAHGAALDKEEANGGSAKQVVGPGGGRDVAGSDFLDMIVEDDDLSGLQPSFTRFLPGSRTAWHMHPLGQVLHITEERGGATSERSTTHLALWVGSAPGALDPETVWAEHPLLRIEDLAEYIGVPVATIYDRRGDARSLWRSSGTPREVHRERPAGLDRCPSGVGAGTNRTISSPRRSPASIARVIMSQW